MRTIMFVIGMIVLMVLVDLCNGCNIPQTEEKPRDVQIIELDTTVIYKDINGNEFIKINNYEKITYDTIPQHNADM